MKWSAIHSAMVVLLLSLVVGCSEEHHLSTRSQEALAHYNNGVMQWEKFYYPEALAAFDTAIQLDSSFAMAWARRALVQEGMRNDIEAKTDISRAMSLLPSVTPYEQRFVRLYNYMLSYANRQAVTLADSMIQLYPDEKEIHRVRGHLFELVKNYEGAIREYKRAIQLDSSYAIAVMSLGYAYSTVGEQDKAVDQMWHYIRLAPDAADPRASFGDILLRVGRYDEAMAQYQKSLVLKPDYWYAVNQIGLIYMLKGRLHDAEQQFHKGLAALPSNQQLKATHLALDGDLNVLRGKYKDAVQQFRDALGIDSVNVEAAYGLVNAFRKLKEFDHAHSVMARIRLELERRDMATSQYMMKYYLYKSRVMLDQDRFVEARLSCDSALQFTTNLTRGPVFQVIADIDVHQQRYEDALDACEEALRVNPNSPEALLMLARTYHAKKDRAMTREIGGRLIEFWSDADTDFVSLRDLRELLGAKHSAPTPSSDPAGMVAMTL